MNDFEATEVCPGTGQQGHMDESAPGDGWHVICPVCGMRWAGGSTIVAPNKDWRSREQSDQVSAETDLEMTTNPEMLRWDEVRDGVRRAFSAWLSDAALRWGERAWAALQESGLTGYMFGDERAECVARAFALGALYREFCARAFEEGEPGGWHDEVGLWLSDSELIDDLTLGILVERLGIDLEDDRIGQPNLTKAFADLVSAYLPGVHDAVLKTLGEETAFAEMWATVNSSDCFPPIPARADEEDEDDEYVVSFPLDDNSVRSIVNSPTADKMVA